MSPKMKKPAGHDFPVPPWWRSRASEIRDSMTDAQFLRRIFEATGRTYTKFNITRYFQDEKPTTTLELTRDIWLAFRKSHTLPRPFVIATTPDDAALIDKKLTGQLDADALDLSSELHDAASGSQPSPIQSDGETRRGTGAKVAVGRASASRR